MAKKKTNFNNIIFFSPESYVPGQYKDSADMYIAQTSGMDIRSVKKMLNGENDLLLSSLDQMAKSLDVVYVMVPVPKNKSMMEKVKILGDKCKMFWKIPQKTFGQALGYCLRDAIEVDEEKNESLASTTARLATVSTSCSFGGKKDGPLIRFQRECMKKMIRWWKDCIEGEKKEE